MPLAAAQSSTAEHSAPDCDTKAILPAGAFSGAKLALSPMPGTMMPMLLGPSRRMPAAWAAALAASSAVPPSAVGVRCSAAVMMQAARAPRRPRARITSGTTAASEQTSARSGATGRLATSG